MGEEGSERPMSSNLSLLTCSHVTPVFFATAMALVITLEICSHTYTEEAAVAEELG